MAACAVVRHADVSEDHHVGASVSARQTPTPAEHVSVDAPQITNSVQPGTLLSIGGNRVGVALLTARRAAQQFVWGAVQSCAGGARTSNGQVSTSAPIHRPSHRASLASDAEASKPPW
uniref:Uncharacterized protein n=1 Tax=Chlamydomonas euryale TaxID=1486919 RepID=A0A7R9VWT6_9CHLO